MKPFSSFFTLLELVTVIAVLGLTASFAVSTIRTDSPTARMREAALRFEAFCSTARFQAMEDGAEKIILFFPDEKLCRLKGEPEEGRVQLSWKIPEGFQLESGEVPEDTAEDGSYELFRFFADGSACGKRVFELHCGELVRKFELSPLTGRFMITEEDNEKL